MGDTYQLVHLLNHPTHPYPLLPHPTVPFPSLVSMSDLLKDYAEHSNGSEEREEREGEGRRGEERVFKDFQNRSNWVLYCSLCCELCFFLLLCASALFTFFFNCCNK